MNLLFDLDGTLIDSAPDLHAAAARMLRDEGQAPLDLDTIRSFIGNGVPVLVERVLKRVFGQVAASDHARLVAVFMRHYNADPTTLTRLYPQVEEVLPQLVSAGHRLALCTNKPEAISRAILRDLGIDAHFAAVIGGDTLPQRKPDPAPLQAAVAALGGGAAAYVGDSEIDEAAARAAGLPFLLFTEGYRKVPVAEMHFAESFRDFAELPALVAALGRPQETC